MRPTSSVFLAAAIAAATVASFSPALEAQVTGATMELRVYSAEDMRPLSGARVVVEGVGVHGITDANGFLTLRNLPTGPRTIEIRYLGHETTRQLLRFEIGRTTRMEFALPLDPIELTGVTADVRTDILVTRGFYDRQQGGLGTYLTREDILRTRPRFLSDLLRRVSGIQVGSSLIRPNASIRTGGRSCPIQFFVDGALASDFNIDEVGADDVEGLEIYRGAATVPPMYNKGTSACGVILIWTRID